IDKLYLTSSHRPIVILIGSAECATRLDRRANGRCPSSTIEHRRGRGCRREALSRRNHVEGEMSWNRTQQQRDSSVCFESVVTYWLRGECKQVACCLTAWWWWLLSWPDDQV